tara:strand:+ start:655 stop:945 length:291 start_codon:yes stop_codon:yes gene_type:complete
LEDKNIKEVEPNLDKLSDELTNNIKNFSSILLYVTHEGDVIMVSTGKMTPIQKNIATKMLVVAGSHSLVLRLVLNLEILFEKITYRLTEWLKPKDN